MIQRALILKQGKEIQPQDIMLENSIEQVLLEPLLEDNGLLHSDLRDRETEVILETLRSFKGSRKKTAEKLGISPRTLRYKLAKLRETGAPVPD